MSYLCVHDRTLFYNPSNKYCIISVKTTDATIPQQARSAYKHRDNLIRFVAVGYELPLTDKVSMELDGEWQNGKHGLQLQVQACTEIVPQTRDGVSRQEDRTCRTHRTCQSPYGREHGTG